LPSIQVNNVQAAREVCEYLIQKGHKKIATITGPDDSTTAVDRLEGYYQALKHNNIEIREDLIIHGNFEFDSGYKAIDRILDREKDITAIFAQNDMMAIGAMKALNEKGLRVPDDIAIIGFDNIPLSSYVTPVLSTVTVPVYELGRTSMKILADLLANVEVSRITTLPTKLTLRQSC
jgi:LacI family transcriptional regulator